MNASATTAIWKAISSARKAAEAIYAAADGGDLQPEVAILTDDSSMGHLIADGIGNSLDATMHPGSWLNDLQTYAGAIGTPIRHYHLRDLLLPKVDVEKLLAPIKLAILPNAFQMSGGLKDAVQNLLASNGRTIVYYYAPNVLDGSGGLQDSGVSDVVGCDMVRGNGSRSFVSEVVRGKAGTAAVPEVVAASVVAPGGCPDFRALQGRVFEATLSLAPSPGGPAGAASPWYHLDESGAAAERGQCSVLARYKPAAGSNGGEGPAAAVCASKADHTAILTAAPFPASALRLIAEAAGVHMFLNTTSALPPPTAGAYLHDASADGVEALGSGVLVRGGPGAAASVPRVVSLPTRPHGWAVTDETGASVCRRCHAFSCALAAGEVAAYVVTVEK